jgi:hypothetical protein
VVDEFEVRRALAVLPDPAHGLELRALPSGHTVVLPAAEEDRVLEVVRDLADGAAGIYYGLNPVPPDLGRPAQAGDVLTRRWLLLDIDPVKPEGLADYSATDQEKERAREVAAAVVDDLTGRGWPAPVLVDSGNGWHVLYRIDVPADDGARALVRDVLRALATRFNGPGATVDTSVYNANRIAKLPGTWARKGPNTADRPHRPCRLLHVPAAVEPVPPALLQSLANTATFSSGEIAPFMVRASAGGEAYGRAALAGELGRLVLAVEGPTQGRNNALNLSAFRLGQLVPAGALSRLEIEAQLH